MPTAAALAFEIGSSQGSAYYPSNQGRLQQEQKYAQIGTPIKSER